MMHDRLGVMEDNLSSILCIQNRQVQDAAAAYMEDYIITVHDDKHGTRIIYPVAIMNQK